MEIAFWIIAITCIASSLLVVGVKNIFHSSLWLILCFLSVAGVFLLLSADFLAAVQILIYIGAISVLIILAIMLTREVQRGNLTNKLKIPALAVVTALGGIMTYMLISSNWTSSDAPAPSTTTAGLAEMLFGSDGFGLGVLITGVILLVAIIGAIVLVRDK